MLAKAKRPPESRSANRLARLSWGMTLDTKDELLLTMLFFGFLFFVVSFPKEGVRAALPSPNAGTFDDRVLFDNDFAGALVSLLASKDCRTSFSVTLIPSVFHLNAPFFRWEVLSICGADRMGEIVMSESLTPAVGGSATVANGFGLTGGASEG